MSGPGEASVRGEAATGPTVTGAAAVAADGGPDERRRPPGWMRAIDVASDVCGVVAATMILVAVLLTCQMIWVRYVSNASTIWQTETVIYLMIGATMIGLPYVQRVRGHVSVDLLSNLLPPVARRALAVFVLALAITVTGVMFWHAFELWHLAFSRGWKTDTVWGPPQWIPYAALPLGFGLFIAQLARDLVGVVLGHDDAAPADEAALAVRDTAGVEASTGSEILDASDASAGLVDERTDAGVTSSPQHPDPR